MNFPIFDPFRQVGTVSFEQNGLYWSYKASVFTSRTGYLRLYGHREQQSLRLGVFCRCGEELTCCGKISRRGLCEPAALCYSLSALPWLPPDGVVPPYSCLVRTEPWGSEVLMLRAAGIPAEYRQYFCFAVPKCAEEIPCLSLLLDKQGNPVLPD